MDPFYSHPPLILVTSPLSAQTSGTEDSRVFFGFPFFLASQTPTSQTLCSSMKDDQFLREIQQHQYNLVIIFPRATLEDKNICCIKPSTSTHFAIRIVPKLCAHHCDHSGKDTIAVYTQFEAGDVPNKIKSSKEEFMHAVKENDAILSTYGSCVPKVFPDGSDERRVYQVKGGSIERVSIADYRDTLPDHKQFIDT